MNLREQQELFLDVIFNGTTERSSTEIAQLIADTEHMSAQQHVDIYRDGVRAGLTQALAETFPVISALVGDDFFGAMAARFIKQQGSSSPDLSDYSPLFAVFIEQFKPAESLVYLADVARLEWNWHQIFHEKDNASLDFEALSKVGDQEVVFRLVNAGRLLQSSWPIQKIWQVNQPEFSGDGSVDLDDGEVFLWIWRNGFEMRIDVVSNAEWSLLKALSKKIPFSKICEELAEQEVDVIFLLPQFVEKGWICDFEIAE